MHLRLILLRAEGWPAGMPVVVVTAGAQAAEAVPTIITCNGSDQKGCP